MNKNTPPLTFKTMMPQFPINLADAVTGHKLQGRTPGKNHNHSMGTGLLEKLGMHGLITREVETGTLSHGGTGSQ
jgi:hypothetical protein